MQTVKTPTTSLSGKNPGTWANGLKVCVIDDQADQIIGITTDANLGTAGATIGFGVTTASWLEKSFLVLEQLQHSMVT